MITQWNAQFYEREIRERTARAFDKAGYIMVGDTKTKMAAKPGPSKPGDYPAVDTSRFMNSLTHEVDRSAPSMKFGSPLTDPPYPVFLEIGTRKMAPRPWARPELELIKPQVIPLIKTEMRGLLK